MTSPVYVADTNIFLATTDVLSFFSEKDLIIPFKVLEELDSIKTRRGSVGASARRVVREIEKLRVAGDLHNGVPNPHGDGTITVSLPMASFGDLDLEVPDNHIIATALSVRVAGTPPVVVTNDICLRLKCGAYSLPCKGTESFSGPVRALHEDVEIDISQMEIDAFYRGEDVYLDEAGDLSPNEHIHLRCIENPKSGALARFVGEGSPLRRIDTDHRALSALGFRPRNREQTYAVDLLMDPEVKLVSVVGMAGTGKTLLSIACALSQLEEAPRSAKRTKRSRFGGHYKRLLVSRPIQPMGKDIGYLPGSLEEKMGPWVQPIYDNIETLLVDEDLFDLYRESGLIKVEAPTYIRGRSIADSFIIIDEAQNLSPHEVKTIVTRVGEGTKIVLTGDVEQIDREGYNEYSNGLAHLIEAFAPSHLSGHVTLTKGERSEIAEFAAQVL